MPIDHAKIRTLRESARLTQTAAARRAGIKQPQWARLERGTGREDSIRLLERVAGVLGVRPGDLIG